MIIEPQILSDKTIIQAIETNLEEAFASAFSSWSRSRFEDSSQFMCNITDFDDLIFNFVLRTRLSSDDVDSAIERVIKQCKALNVGIMWTISPGSRPLSLKTSLDIHGFTYLGSVRGMAINLNQINHPQDLPQRLTIQNVRDVKTFHTWIETMIAGFEMANVEDEFASALLSNALEDDSRWQYFLAWLDDKPIATSALFLGTEAVGVYCVSTLPEAYGKGIGTAMTVAALEFGRKKNYELAILQASKMGYNVYRRLGFREYCQLDHYAWRG